MVDPNLLTGFVDSIRDRCPGSFKGKKLIKIAVQKERRLLIFHPIKNLIFVLEGTRDIVYKEKNECHPGVVMMGLSGRTWEMHPKSVKMETYARYFLDKADTEWLKRNDYELV